MVIEKWDPFRELRRIEASFDRPWRGFGVDGRARSWAAPLDVLEEGDSIVVRASVPGVRPEDVEVTVEDGVLTIKSEANGEHEERDGHYLMRERRSGSFYRRLRLPETVDTDQAESTYEQGVLTITFPKVEAKKAKRLAIKAA